MTNLVTKNSTKIEALTSKLLSTLNESVFFSEITKHLSQLHNAEEIIINLIHEDSSVRMVAKNGQALENSERELKATGVCGHVVKSKRAYFSNNTSRDPIFASSEDKSIVAELCVPVLIDGVIIATLHLRTRNEEVKFQKEDINLILELLNEIHGPLLNMKMFLSAKFLNESLMKKIKEKEQEILKNRNGIQLADTYKIEEKEIIGKSQVMKDLLSRVDRASATSANIFIHGESGVGKEMVARRVHCRSERRDHGFISVDCTMGSDDNLEAEIFGREEMDLSKGLKIMKGIVETCNGGTLFINNIDKMSLRLQSKLINFIKDGIFFRVGSQSPLRSNIRTIGAAHTDIKELVESGKFREDLFFTLATVELRVPSLKERKEDIEFLANYFLNKGKSIEGQKSMSPGVVKQLVEYKWPGNVRELQSIMERAFILSDSSIIEQDHLADSVKNEEVEVVVEEAEVLGYREMTLNDLEKHHICQTLEHLSGNKTKTAKVLGITVKTLYNKLHSYGMIDAKEVI